MNEKHLLIGLGGTGGKILRAFRQRLWTEYEKVEREKLPISFIYVDSDAEMLKAENVAYETIHGNCCFTPSEFVDIKKHSDIDAIFSNPQGNKRLLGVMGNVNETQEAVCPVGAAADQKRRAGRMLFAANIDSFVAKLTTEKRALDNKIVGGVLNIHIFAGLAGGTGSGSIVDTITQVRKWMFENNLAEAKQCNVTVYCQLPEDTPPTNWNTGRYKANGYAALLELNNMFCSHYNEQSKDATCKPPYDVTSSVDFARMYLSFDNPTPDNVRKGCIPQALKIAGGMILYSNKNDRGYEVTDPLELANLVADFAYTRVFLPPNEQSGQFGRFYSFENLSGCRDEYDETADPELTTPLAVRTKAVGSFGIKRIVTPESAIKEHIAYTLGQGILQQMMYDNWSNTSGYRNEPKAFDVHSYVGDDSRMMGWMLSEDYLRLKKHVLEGDKKEGWPEGEFSTYWDPCIDAWTEVARGAGSSFEKLIELCRGGFETGFRGKGVVKFFEGKAEAINEHYSRQICDNVETQLFKLWFDGSLSLSQLTDVVAELSKQTRNRATAYGEKVLVELEQQCKEKEALIEKIVLEYRSAMAIKRPFIFGNRIEKTVLYSKQLYRAKTEVAAVRYFAQPLAEALVHRLEDLAKRIDDFVKSVNTLIAFTKERMMILADMNSDKVMENDIDGTEKMTDPVVELYSRRKLAQLEQTLRTDQDKMRSINEIMRTAIAEALASEGHFTNVLRLNSQLLSKVLLGGVYDKIIAFHDKLCIEQSSKVLGVPILQRLRQKYGNNEQDLLRFASDIVKASGVFLQFDMNQIRQDIDNNPPAELSKNVLFKRILVSLPKTTDPELQGFADDLKRAIESSIDGAENADIQVSTEGTAENEITVMCITNGVPMRSIVSCNTLKAEYNRLLSLDPRNYVVLHTEGRAGDYPDVFAKPAMTPDEERELVMPYLIVDVALEKVMKDEGGSEEYGEADKDFFGNAEVKPWGATTFTEMPYNDRIVHERRSVIQKLYNAAMEEAFEEVDKGVLSEMKAKKEEIKQKIMTAIGGLMKSEATPKPKVKDFAAWTEKAVKMVMEYKPQD